ncbi:hypothetical protein B0E54_01922 [Micromonospora sp. MH99]|nr:hypothetical protein [Micromonospora sp. MH99]
MRRHYVRGHSVRGHMRNGRWVSPHYRSDHYRLSSYRGVIRKERQGGIGRIVVFMSVLCLLGSCVNWLSSRNESSAPDKGRAERALAILDGQAQATRMPEPPIAPPAGSPASDSCATEQRAYDSWHDRLGPLTDGLTPPTPHELEQLNTDAQAYRSTVAALSDPQVGDLVFAIATYRASVAAAMTEPASIQTLGSLVTAGLGVNGAHRAYQARC